MPAPELSTRSRRLPASPIRRLAPLAVAATAAGKRVHALNIGQPDIPTPPEMLERLRSFNGPNVAYGPSEGLPEFLEAVRRYHAALGIELEPGEIFATTGGSEALQFLFSILCDQGDEVVVFEPFYTNYNGFSELVGVRCVPVTSRVEDGYRLPPDAEIERAITPRTRALLICSPNNPTGTVYREDELRRLGAICRERGLFLISDEVYREFVYDGRQHVSALALPGLGDHVVVADSLSKRVSMCGSRVGWVATRNRAVLDALLRAGQARLCPPTLGQLMGSALADVPARYMEDVIAEYERRRDTVYDALREMDGVRLERPEGAFYCCARFPIDDGQKFAEFLLRDFEIDGETVMLAPADGFYATAGLGISELRIAYVLDRERLKRSMRILREGLEAYPGRKA